MRRAFAVTTLVFLLLPGRSSAQIECPVDSVYANCGWIASTAPSLAISNSCVRPGEGGWAVASYNLRAGTSRTRATSANDEILSQCRLRDVFALSGPVSAEPRLIWAQLSLAYFLWSDVGIAWNDIPGQCGAGAMLFSGSSSVADSLHAGVFTTYTLERTLVLPIWVAPNVLFSTGYSTFAWGTRVARANLDVSLDFAGVPPGYTVTSCQGFSTTGDEPVPARGTSWGRLKTLYR